MCLTELIRMILINLRQNKGKVFLTSLGIIIGTLTIILVIAIGRGGEEEIARQYSYMSAETIYVNVDYSRELNREKVPQIKLEHLEPILDENPYLSRIYLRNTFFEEGKISGEKKFFSFAAVTEGYAEVSRLETELGEDFSESDYTSSRRVVILGHQIALQNFGDPQQAIGQHIQIGNKLYEVVGVLKKKAEGLQGLSPDDTVFIPFQTALENRLLKSTDIPQAVGLAVGTDQINQAIKRLKSSLDYLLEDTTMYVIEDAGGRIDAAMESARTMKLLLISVATIVFIVGGIGIMNVLFVSVKERTREIGILKALGTSKKDILLQFLLESVGMGLVGGMIGVLLSFAVLPLMKYTQIPVAPSISGILAAFGFAMATSALFGFYPAWKASCLKPIDALNHD